MFGKIEVIKSQCYFNLQLLSFWEKGKYNFSGKFENFYLYTSQTSINQSKRIVRILDVYVGCLDNRTADFSLW